MEVGESSNAGGGSNQSTYLINCSDLLFGPVIWQDAHYRLYRGSYKGIDVEIKRIQSNASAEQIRKFEREVRMHSKADHENVVKFLAATKEPAMLVTELMAQTLKHSLESIRPDTLPLRLALTHALGISRAMEHLHANGIIHRALKPSNIFLTDDKLTVKVGDFGESREVLGGDFTPYVGIDPWIAPEMMNQEKQSHLIAYGDTGVIFDEFKGLKTIYDKKVDVFSFGHVLYELILNKAPYDDLNFNHDNDAMFFIGYAQSRSNLRPTTTGVPENILPLLRKCWEVDPRHRPDFNQISQILEATLSTLSNNPSTSLVATKTETNGEERKLMRNRILKWIGEVAAKISVEEMIKCCMSEA